MFVDSFYSRTRLELKIGRKKRTWRTLPTLLQSQQRNTNHLPYKTTLKLDWMLPVFHITLNKTETKSEQMELIIDLIPFFKFMDKTYSSRLVARLINCGRKCHHVMGMSPWPATLLSKETLKELRHRRKGKPLEILKQYKYMYVKRLLLSYVLWGAYDGEDKKKIGNMPCTCTAAASCK